MTIAIVTDSTCDIPETLAKTYNIHIVANYIIIDGVSYEDGSGISRQEFYNRLPSLKQLPTTSTAPAGVYEALYANLLAHGYEHIISIHLAATLSGICNAARLGGEAFPGKVTVIDSGTMSMGLGFIVLAAAKAAQAGLSLELTVQHTHATRQRLRAAAMLETIEYVRRSGRLSWARALVSTLLNIHPLFEIREGKVMSLGNTRSRQKGILRLKKLIEQAAPLESLAILHTNDPVEAQQLWNMIEVPIAQQPIIVNVTTAIGTHLGPKGLGFAYVSGKILNT